MLHDRINIWDSGEYSYAGACGFQPNLRTYLHEGQKTRPCILVIPGGGYRMVSPTEGEIVAKCFYEKGYQTFVGTYTTNFTGQKPLKKQPLQDISRMVRTLRENAPKYQIDPNQIILCGFSAGAHLCGSLCVHWEEITDLKYIHVSNRPNGAILSYPVITSGENAHRDSFVALLGDAPTEEDLEWASLEKQVTKDTPPIFLWQTVSDELVPVENSYLMAMALKQANVPFEHHVFPKGAHGLSLSNEVWAKGEYGEPYCLEQVSQIEKAYLSEKVQLSKEQVGFLKYLLHPGKLPESMIPPRKPVAEVSLWPEMADMWIRENCLKSQEKK